MPIISLRLWIQHHPSPLVSTLRSGTRPKSQLARADITRETLETASDFALSQKHQLASSSKVSKPLASLDTDAEPPIKSGRVTRAASSKVGAEVAVKAEKVNSPKRGSAPRGVKRKKVEPVPATSDEDAIVEADGAVVAEPDAVSKSFEPPTSDCELLQTIHSKSLAASTPQMSLRPMAKRGGRSASAATTSRAGSRAPRERSGGFTLRVRLSMLTWFLVSVNPSAPVPVTGTLGLS